MNNISEIIARNPTIDSNRFDLVGIDGNPFSIMGHVKNAMKHHKWNFNDISTVVTFMMSSDYSNLLNVASSVIYSSPFYVNNNDDDDDYV